MRTTIELPDELLTRAKQSAAFGGISLREFFIQAVELRLSPHKPKVRRPPPRVGVPGGPPIGLLTPEQLEESFFGGVPGAE